MPMSGSEKSSSRRELYKTPFSRAYWAQAASEFKDLKVLVFAALMIALRVALKSVSIPIAADLRINTAFFINAFGAMVFGPVVAIPAAAISDTLGVILFPQGPYYFPFIFTEIAGSVIFSLFLYRADITAVRVILSRFCICFFVNILLQTPIMRGYYAYTGTSSLVSLFDTVRIAKNLVLFPIESVLLVVFLRAVVPPVQRLGFVRSSVDKLSLSKKHIIFLVVFFLVGAGSTAGYAVYDYNHKSFSASYTAKERLEKNQEMNEWVQQEYPEWNGEWTVTIIESARSQVLNPEMTYELAIYQIDTELFEKKCAEDPAFTLDTLRGLSKTKAAKNEILARVGQGKAVTDKKSGQHLSLICDFTEPNP